MMKSFLAMFGFSPSVPLVIPNDGWPPLPPGMPPICYAIDIEARAFVQQAKADRLTWHRDNPARS